MGELGPKVKVRGTKESLMEGLFADDIGLLAENERMLHRIVDKFDWMCERRKVSECWKEYSYSTLSHQFNGL